MIFSLLEARIYLYSYFELGARWAYKLKWFWPADSIVELAVS